MASALQNVRDGLVPYESNLSWVEWIVEETDLHPRDFSCFCFFGVLDVGKETSWRRLKSYLTQCWFVTGILWCICPFWSCPYLLRGSGPLWTPCVWLIGIFPSSFPIVLLLPTCPTCRHPPTHPPKAALRWSGLQDWQADSPSIAQTWLGSGRSYWQKPKRQPPWNPNPRSQVLK